MATQTNSSVTLWSQLGQLLADGIFPTTTNQLNTNQSDHSDDTSTKLAYHDLAVAATDSVSLGSLKVYSQICKHLDIADLEANLALVATFQSCLRLSTYRITVLKPTIRVCDHDVAMLKYLALAACAKAGSCNLYDHLMTNLAAATDLNAVVYAIWCHDQAAEIMANLTDGLFDDRNLIAGADMTLRNLDGSQIQPQDPEYAFLKPYIDQHYDQPGDDLAASTELNPVVVRAVQRFYDYDEANPAPRGDKLTAKESAELFMTVFDLEDRLKVSGYQADWLRNFRYLLDIMELSHNPISPACLRAICDDLCQHGVKAIDLLIQEGITLGVQLE